MPTITPCLTFGRQAEEAVRFYVSALPGSELLHITRCGEGEPQPAGSVRTVRFKLCGQEWWTGSACRGRWVVDRFGVTWQVAPAVAWEMVNDPDPVASQRVVDAVLGMTKLDADTLKRAYAGE